MSRVRARPGFSRRTLVAHALALGEIKRNAPLRELGRAFDKRPVDFLGLPRAKGLAERRGRTAIFGDKQYAARVTVEPMHKHRSVIALGERGEHPVNVPRGARAALHGEAEGLVEDEHVGVLVERHIAQRARILGVGARRCGRGGRVQIERRDADCLPLFETRRGLDALAVDPHLALAADLGEMRERKRRHAPLEPAVEPQARLVLGDGRLGDARSERLCHGELAHARRCGAPAPAGSTILSE